MTAAMRCRYSFEEQERLIPGISECLSLAGSVSTDCLMGTAGYAASETFPGIWGMSHLAELGTTARRHKNDNGYLLNVCSSPYETFAESGNNGGSITWYCLY
jgi:hypothetical protein